MSRRAKIREYIDVRRCSGVVERVCDGLSGSAVEAALRYLELNLDGRQLGMQCPHCDSEAVSAVRRFFLGPPRMRWRESIKRLECNYCHATGDFIDAVTEATVPRYLVIEALTNHDSPGCRATVGYTLPLLTPADKNYSVHLAVKLHVWQSQSAFASTFFDILIWLLLNEPDMIMDDASRHAPPFGRYGLIHPDVLARMKLVASLDSPAAPDPDPEKVKILAEYWGGTPNDYEAARLELQGSVEFDERSARMGMWKDISAHFGTMDDFERELKEWQSRAEYDERMRMKERLDAISTVWPAPEEIQPTPKDIPSYVTTIQNHCPVLLDRMQLLDEDVQRECTKLWLFKNRVVEASGVFPGMEVMLELVRATVGDDEAVGRCGGQPERGKRNARQTIPRDVQTFVWRRDEGRCVECGSREELEFDHIIPLSRGGSNSARNLQLLCQFCNRSKGNRI